VMGEKGTEECEKNEEVGAFRREVGENWRKYRHEKFGVKHSQRGRSGIIR